jgi:hypothetical protein
MSQHESIHISIHFNGKHFSEKTASNPTVGGIKIEAMTSFDLSPSDAGKYVLVHGDIELDDTKHIASFGKDELHWKLELKDRQKFHITVLYVGKEPFVEVIHADPTFGGVKSEAMSVFDLELAAASNYVLQYEGTDLDDTNHVSTLGHAKLTLTLTLAKEPVKG